jgi:ADP-heptose:LPS heptosyltransferase
VKEIYFDLSQCRGIGDTICSTPTIKKLFDSYKRKINLITPNPQVLQNNPYIDRIFLPDEVSIEFIKTNFIYHASFDKINKCDIEIKHNVMDIRQYHAINQGFMLGNDELSCEYYPNKIDSINNLPEKYVLIHPVQTWPNRTWSKEFWMELTEKLNNLNISVVSIGEDGVELGSHFVEKPIFDFEIRLGLNLMKKTTLDQVHYLIENSLCFVTMDSGLLHLAGTTDANILMLGSAVKPEFRIPYRNGSQDYKIHYIKGDCGIECVSDMKYGVRDWNTIHGVPRLIDCLEGKSSYECHPKPQKVLDTIVHNILQKPKVKPNPKIRLSHLILNPNIPLDIPFDKWSSTINKQNQSLDYFEKIKDKFHSYKKIVSVVNRDELPKETCLHPEIIETSKEFKNNPPVLTYGHYGAYMAHKRAVLEDFSEELDAIVIIEGDVVGTVSPEILYDKIIEGYKFGIENNASMITFAGPCFFSGGDWWSIVEEKGDWLKVPHFLLGSMYMIFSKDRELFIKKYQDRGWHSPDFWLAWTFHDRIPIYSTKDPYVEQAQGFSLLDYQEKTTYFS